MRQLVTFLALLIISFSGWSQVGDTPKTKPLKIEVANKKDEQGKTKKGTVLRIPSIVGSDPEINFKDSLKGRKPVKMLPDRELVQAGTGMKIDPKVRPKPKEGSKEYFPSIFLGDVRTKSQFLRVEYRDHGRVDGDRIRIDLNDNLILRNDFLLGEFDSVIIDLSLGFNRLVFTAKNEGDFAPNTAEVRLIDESGEVIFSNLWGLSTQSKASISIIRER